MPLSLIILLLTFHACTFILILKILKFMQSNTKTTLTVWKHVHHPRFDPQSMRVLLTPEEIEALPYKTISYDELWELMSHDDFNPPGVYNSFDPRSPSRRLVELRDREVGQDTQYRYILTASAHDPSPQTPLTV